MKTRLQLSARKKETGGVVSTKSGSILPKPIAASAASLASQAASTPITAAAASAAASTRTVTKSSLTPAFSMTMDIIKKEGIRGLYRGLSASYLGVSEGVIQWVLYEVSVFFFFFFCVLLYGSLTIHVPPCVAIQTIKRRHHDQP